MNNYDRGLRYCSRGLKGSKGHWLKAEEVEGIFCPIHKVRVRSRPWRNRHAQRKGLVK
jgi:hypothetical protein